MTVAVQCIGGPGLARYRAVQRRRDAARSAACGELSELVEAHYAQTLDDIWWGLTDAEQSELVGGKPCS